MMGAARARPLHVAFFNRAFPPETAATGQFLAELGEDLIERHGWRVSVVTGTRAAAGRRPVRRERYRGIEVLRAWGTRFPKRRVAGRFSNYLTYFLSACWTGLRLDRPDVVVALTDPPVIGLAAYLASRRFRAPLVIAFQDIFSEVGRLLDDFQSETVYRVLDGVTRFLATRADATVALGDTMASRLIDEKGADPARLTVIPPWADCAAIVPWSRVNAFSRAHGLEQRFVVMHSGNMGLAQDLEHLVPAAASLAAYPDIDLVLVGDGVRRAALEAQARAAGLRNVRFLPFQPLERLTESFAAAHVFVVSLRRGFAGYIVPSRIGGILAAGRPYVAAVEPLSEIAALTRKHDCGLLAAPGDPRDLAEKILSLYHDRPRAERLGRNGRRAALEADRPIQVDAYDDLLRRVASMRDETSARRPRRLLAGNRSDADRLAKHDRRAVSTR